MPEFEAPQVDTSSAPSLPSDKALDARSHRSALVIVFLVVFIDLLGFGIVLPLLPLYADDLLKPLFPGEDNVPLRGVLLGLLMSAYSFTQFFFAPLWGRISDRVGRRPLILLGLGGSVVFYTLFGVASDLGAAGLQALGLVLLFVARLGGGAAAATIGTAQAVIADTTTPDNRARGMASIGAAFGIGFTFGPLLGFASLFVPVDGAPGYLAGCLSLVAALIALYLLPETLRTGASTHLRRRLLDWEGLQQVLRTPAVGILVISFFLATFAFGGLESTLSLVNRILLTGEELTRAAREQLLTKEAAKSTDRINFLVFAYIGLVLMIIQGVIYRRLVKRVGEVRFLRAGVLLMAVGLIGGVGVLELRQEMPSRAALLACALVVMTVAVIGFAFMTPSVQALVSRRTDPARQGEVLSINQSAAAMARILGPLVGLSLFDLLPSHVLPYECGAVLLVLVFFLSLRIRPEI